MTDSKLEWLATLSDEEAMDLAHDLLEYCTKTVRGINEESRKSLDRMNDLDRTAGSNRLYRSYKSSVIYN